MESNCARSFKKKAIEFRLTSVVSCDITGSRFRGLTESVSDGTKQEDGRYIPTANDSH
jgi:hypothetical protein